MTITPLHRPILDPGFIPAPIWNRTYRNLVRQSGEARPLAIALDRGDGSISVFNTEVLPHNGTNIALNRKYVERLVKFLLWHRGGYRIIIAGEPAIAAMIKGIYSPTGERAFDSLFLGKKIYGQAIVVEECPLDKMPQASERSIALGRNLDGCRIGFDLGGSDRKCAALIDGKVIFSEEVAWDPYFESNPQYHFDGIDDTIRRAAEKLPRIDAIGGSSAGCYVNNEVRAASLFRGISDDDFEKRIRRIFFELKAKWGNVPFEVLNDGEVTALAGSMSMNDNAVLGVSMGTAQASGYVDAHGHLTPWLDELGFTPLDYRDDAPADEWSGDIGCGVQYFSQQAVARLLPSAGIEAPKEMPFAERLIKVQQLMAKGDPRARKIYETIGVYFGYAIGHYAEFCEFRNLLILGRVTSGEGGEVILEKAAEVMRDEFPELAGCIELRTPDEQDKRHGQAIAAASLPKL